MRTGKWLNVQLNERQDIFMLHNLQHQFAYNPWTRIGLKPPRCA